LITTKKNQKTLIADLDEQILTNEGSGVLNWMLEGLAKLRADDWQLHLNKAQQARVDNLLLESDALSIFVKNELVRAEASQLTVPDSFTAFAEFCTQRGWTTLSRNKFGQLIGDGVTRLEWLKTSRGQCEETV
jgi:putative DNA primase/helicase